MWEWAPSDRSREKSFPEGDDAADSLFSPLPEIKQLPDISLPRYSCVLNAEDSRSTSRLWKMEKRKEKTRIPETSEQPGSLLFPTDVSVPVTRYLFQWCLINAFLLRGWLLSQTVWTTNKHNSDYLYANVLSLWNWKTKKKSTAPTESPKAVLQVSRLGKSVTLLTMAIKPKQN